MYIHIYTCLYIYRYRTVPDTDTKLSGSVTENPLISQPSAVGWVWLVDSVSHYSRRKDLPGYGSSTIKERESLLNW